MDRDIKVSELAEEFGVHRNTIRNWIQSGTLPARKSPGRRYLIKDDDYRTLCARFGKTPRSPRDEAAPSEAENKTLQRPALPILRLRKKANTLYADPSWADSCLGCGTCANSCPISGVDGLDPCKIVRMAILGMEEELIESNWPWKCALCGKCEQACPMNIEIVGLMRRIRGRRDRKKVPGPIHKGILSYLKRGNNIGIPRDDFLRVLKEVGDELAAESCPGFNPPIDRHGARLLVTMNSKIPFVEPLEMKWWWKIYHAAGESWTISSENWDGVNWGLFSGDDAALKAITGRVIDNLDRLGCEALLLPE